MQEPAWDREVSPANGWRRLVRRAWWIPLMLPALVFVFHLPHFGRLQYNDYYGVVALVVEDDLHLTRDPWTWLTLKSNEHTVTLPGLVYAANMVVVSGDNRGLSTFALLLLGVEVVVLACLLRRVAGASAGPLGMAVAFLVFSPAAAHSVVMGFSGTIWFLSNVMTVLAIAGLAFGSDRSPPRIATTLCFGILGAFSYSTNFSLWPGLLVGSALQKRPRRHLVMLAATWAAVAAFHTGAYRLRYGRLEHLPWHPDLNLTDLPRMVAYTTAYLGNPFASKPVVASAVGCLGLAALAVLAWRTIRRADSDARAAVAPWVALAIYPLGNAVATAVGRSGFGLHQALASRYVSVAMLFWVSLVGIAASVGWRPAKRRLAVLLSASLITVLVGATWISGWATLRAYLGRAAEHPLAEQAILLAIDDERTLSFVTPAREQIAGIYSFLAATHHVPFDRPRPQAGVGDLEVELSAAPSPEVVGRFVGGRRAGDGYALAEGWVGLDRGQVDAVVLVDEHGQVHGEMVVGLPSRARASGRSGATTGWAGFVRLGPEATQLTAYARIRDQAVFNQLEGSHTAPAATPDG